MSSGSRAATTTAAGLAGSCTSAAVPLVLSTPLDVVSLAEDDADALVLLLLVSSDRKLSS